MILWDFYIFTQPIVLILGPNCGDPGTPFNGRQIGNNFNEDAIVLFFCNAGFTLVGASVITCESGQWSAELPQCSGEHTKPSHAEVFWEKNIFARSLISQHWYEIWNPSCLSSYEIQNT